ncbi:MAG TPA: histidine phosphatase family protein [Actinocrinis sp.]|nr:histidine phosphatase family protein [Actinocrinis sp.]
MSALPSEITAVRHGQSTANAAFALADATGALTVPITARDADLDLTDLGHAQAAALGHALADNPPDLVYCSPYRRTRRTLDEVLCALAETGTPPPQRIRYDERLRDRETGAWEMQTYAALRRDYPAEMARRDRVGPYYFRPPCGENFPDVALRVRSALRDALPEAAGKRLLIVTHDAVVLTLRLILDHLDENVLADNLLGGGSIGSIGNCTVTRWAGGEGTTHLRLTAYNDAEHLRVLDEELARP